MVKSITERPVNYLLIMNLCGIVLADLYLLYFIKVMNEKTYLEYEVKLLENQAELQYAYYANQEQKYNRTIQILHDVDKHINSIEKLYENGISKEAGIYTRQIQNMLKPLIPIKYTGNPILDILLTDKALLMSDKQIIFNVKIDNVDLNFIDPIDVTTIWGNLLDNAIEACEQMEQETYITMSIKSFHEMVSINIANNCNSVIWKNGLPVSEKGNNRGIGLLNVKRSIEKYDGNMTLREENGQFTVEILLNT
jgi:sensor histidine kinase regulating citrate/malate metabolism